MIINTNMNALNAHRNMGINNTAAGKSMEKLSSGLRINRAGDDAAGLAISEKMRGQIRGLDQASRNSQDGISMIQTAEGALNETHNIVQRMRELAVQAGNDTNTAEDRTEIQKEVEQLKKEIDRISETTEFNGQTLLDGSMAAKGTSSNAAAISNGSLDGLNEGNYEFKITTASTKTTTAVGAGVPATNIKDLDLTLNGVKIDFSDLTDGASADANAALVIARINEYSDKTGVKATVDTTDADKFTLSSEQFGNTEIVAGGANSTLVGVATKGVNAVVDITNNGQKTTVTGKGQEINYNGAEFKATGALNATSTVTVTNSGSKLQIGANTNQNMSVAINAISTKTLGNGTDGFVKDIDLTTQKGANDAIKTLDAAIKEVSAERSKLGAIQNRLDHTTSNLNNTSENLTAAESRIRDVDMAKEMLSFSKNNILNQAAQSMLAQAKSQPEGVLQLLR